MIYIFWTCANREEAEKIISSLLKERYIACASIFPPVTSLFRWEGKVQREEEIKVLLKSKQEYFEKISSYIQAHCSYDVPEIASVKAEEVFEPYLSWLVQETTN